VGAPHLEAESRARFHQLMDEAFDRDYLTNNGPLVQRLETEIAEMHHVKHCAVTSNATLAQIFLLKALGLCGEVILPSFTFIATAHACVWENLTPVFCDIRPDNLMIDTDDVERLITPRTSAVIGVHLFGNTCDVERLSEICRRRGLHLIFDAAHAFACRRGNISVGGFGDAEFLSFHATKFFGTFEGGAVVTNNPEIDRQIRFLRNFGFRDYDDVGFLGLNGKMAEASAAMGLAALPEVPGRIKRLRSTCLLYRKNFASLPGISILPVGEDGISNYQYFVVLIDRHKFGVSRDVLYRILWAENILVRRYFSPGCHAMSYYRGRRMGASRSLPVTEDVSSRILCFPTNLDDPERVVAAIGELLRVIRNSAVNVEAWAESNP
jgi:dTDP-4-amino-4,6-dideoxygalactose transaminase